MAALLEESHWGGPCIRFSCHCGREPITLPALPVIKEEPEDETNDVDY